MKNGWQLKKLGDVCLFENGDRGENYPSKSVQTSSGVPFINAGHLTDHGIDVGTLSYIPRDRFALLGNGKVRKGDILFCLRGSLGKFASVGEITEGAIASSLVIVRPREQVLKNNMLAYFQSDLCAEMIKQFKNGAAQPNLSAASLKSFDIPVPPLAEQRRIVGILDEAFAGIATAKAHAEQNRQNARAIFESHLESVFSQRGKRWVENTLKSITTKIGSGATPRGGEDSYKTEGISLIRSLNVHDLAFKYSKLAFLDDTQADELSNVEVKSRDVFVEYHGRFRGAVYDCSRRRAPRSCKSTCVDYSTNSGFFRTRVSPLHADFKTLQDPITHHRRRRWCNSTSYHQSADSRVYSPLS